MVAAGVMLHRVLVIALRIRRALVSAALLVAVVVLYLTVFTRGGIWS